MVKTCAKDFLIIQERCTNYALYFSLPYEKEGNKKELRCFRKIPESTSLPD